MRRQFLAGVLLLGAAALVGSAAATAQYQLKQKFTLGGEGGWDYLTYDPAGKRLFISRGTRVQVVDPAKGTILAEIPIPPASTASRWPRNWAKVLPATAVKTP